MNFNDVINTVERIAPQAQNNYLEAIRRGEQLFNDHQITTPLRMAHFLAQALHETGGFNVLRENMNYSAKRMLQIFGVGNHSAAVTPAEAAILGQPSRGHCRKGVRPRQPAEGARTRQYDAR